MKPCTQKNVFYIGKLQSPFYSVTFKHFCVTFDASKVPFKEFFSHWYSGVSY
jgi:hypothetical protein